MPIQRSLLIKVCTQFDFVLLLRFMQPETPQTFCITRGKQTHKGNQLGIISLEVIQKCAKFTNFAKLYIFLILQYSTTEL